VLDFLAMTPRPPGCDVLVNNPPYRIAMVRMEHALELQFRLVMLLLKLPFLSTGKRFECSHKRGCLRRVHVLAERLKEYSPREAMGTEMGNGDTSRSRMGSLRLDHPGGGRGPRSLDRRAIPLSDF
jgi:hypothetical protein